MLAEGKPPGWVAPLLHRQGRLISHRRPGPLDEDDDKKLIKKARDLAEALSSYEKLEAEVEDRHGFPVPEAVEAASIALDDLIEYLESQLSPPRRGGPTPDSRRWICAAVCGYVWHRQHGKLQPYSPKLQKACEEYWKACGHPETGKPGSGNTAKHWEVFRVECTNDVEYVEYLDQLAERLTTR
jgi:hypothetical protein